jgi:hypothetical protein
VLARVAPSGQLADSAFEVEVARRLTDAGAPVGRLHPRGGARVHTRNAFAVSLWTYYEPLEAEIAPADRADAFVRHHAALRRTDQMPDRPHWRAEGLRRLRAALAPGGIP